MQDKPFILWSIRAAGWLTNSGTYSSELKNARRFDQFEATVFARNHIQRGALGLIPVRVEDVQAILG